MNDFGTRWDAEQDLGNGTPPVDAVAGSGEPARTGGRTPARIAASAQNPGGPRDGTVLRVLGPGDVDTVAALEARIFAEDPWSLAMVAEELSAPGRHYVAALVEGEAIGYAGIRIGGDCDVMTIGVVEAHRGCGVGTLLLENLLAAAGRGGAHRVFLEVRASNAAAQGLYLARGFRRIGRVRRYFRNPTEDAVTMRLELTDAP